MCRFVAVKAAFVNALLLTSPPPTRPRGTTVLRARLYDPIVDDWIPPPSDEIRRIQGDLIEPMRFLSSPVFFSTDEGTGRRHRGLSCLPSHNKGGTSNRPLLFVSNHQLVGIDSWMVVSEILKERNIFARSLVHPLVYEPEIGGATDSFLPTFGAVKVSPHNLYRLMETNQPALLFPGGARESFHGRGEEYTLKGWPRDGKTDFVRIAAKFNATIVPFSSVGAAESALFLTDRPLERKEIPFGIGDAVANWMGEYAPYDARYDNGEILTFPLVLPKPIPARHMFLFHRPICTSAIDYRDRENCRKAYERVKSDIRGGINDLLIATKKDPFKEPVRRMVYERLWNKQAPTFPLKELNPVKTSFNNNS